ncbi:MAG: MIP/aquaporin family protein [Stellaceae bacterium]
MSMSLAADRSTPHHEDAPLVGHPHPHDKLHPRLYAAEFFGTALLVLAGLSLVILLFGTGSPVSALLPSAAARRAIAGFLFGSVGTLVTLSPLGRVSGAHINPVVTLAFWLERKIAWRDALLYVAAQYAGAVLGALPLLAWGSIGRSVEFGATVPLNDVAPWLPVLGEAGSAFLLVVTIFVFTAHRETRPFTPYTMAPLFSFLVWLEAPLSGTSANPARSFGPALVAWVWHRQWVYVVGPCLGAAVAVALLRLEFWGRHRPHEARVFHFRHPAPAARR